MNCFPGDVLVEEPPQLALPRQHGHDHDRVTADDPATAAADDVQVAVGLFAVEGAHRGEEFDAVHVGSHALGMFHPSSFSPHV